MSNLDAKLREQMRFELKRLQLELGITTLYVTHDQAEALALSDEVAVFNAGHIMQRGDPGSIYHHPNCAFVADFIGSTNFLEGKVAEAGGSDGRAVIETAHGNISCAFMKPPAAGAAALLVVRPEDVVLTAAGPGANGFAGKVENRIFLGEMIDYLIRAGSDEIRVRARPEWDFSIGQQVSVELPPEKCLGLPRPAAGTPQARAVHGAT